MPHFICSLHLRLSQQQEALEKQIAAEETAIKEKEDKLDGLQPALDSLQKAILPLQDMLGLPLDRVREEESLTSGFGGLTFQSVICQSCSRFTMILLDKIQIYF